MAHEGNVSDVGIYVKQVADLIRKALASNMDTFVRVKPPIVTARRVHKQRCFIQAGNNRVKVPRRPVETVRKDN